MWVAGKDAFEKEIETPFWRALLFFAPPSAFLTPVFSDNASPGSQQPGHSVTSDARQGRDRSRLFLTVSLHCAFKPPLAELGKCFFVRLGVAVAGGGEYSPFTRTSVDAKTFLGNLEEDSTSDNRVEEDNCQRCPWPLALTFSAFKTDGKTLLFRMGISSIECF